MHRGLREFIQWIETHRDTDLVRLNAPATVAELAELEQELGEPLPTDLRLVLTRFNGGKLPNGTLLPAGIGPGTIGATVREYAAKVGKDFLNPDLLLPFFRTEDDSLLAFDRSAGPVADTWPIVDYFPDTGEHNLVYRTFDGFCRVCVANWTSPDFSKDFDLDVYLRQGQRHVSVEQDVGAAHVTVAHASKRLGLPAQALEHYLMAARCIPPLPWCDWEALKIAAILDKDQAAREAASRLSTIGPDSTWARRETTPVKVAEVCAPIAARAPDKRPWLRIFDQLLAQVQNDPDATATVGAIRQAIVNGQEAPAPRHGRQGLVPNTGDTESWWQALRSSYHQGYVRDEDLLLDPGLQPLRRQREFGELLSFRRDF